MSNTVGYVLLASSAVPGILGWDLSRRGLKQVESAATEAERAAKEARGTVRDVQSAIAEASGEEAVAAARQTSEVVEKTDALTTGLGEVSEALKGMTGVFAPARVLFAIAFVLVLAALVSLDVVTLGSGS